uniref:Uncharacterized protein n=1 Tax=Grammatophora oceanica TaxID=210454 RepID=A0A7S1VAR1_9STRA|mmetsp:Transcript_41422/g.61304  ORF Transcript_41422/g.61304 Transcript_41422/m.61304 type:complete len:122 (+) Transcript_41422:199-564(+)
MGIRPTQGRLFSRGYLPKTVPMLSNDEVGPARRNITSEKAKTSRVARNGINLFQMQLLGSAIAVADAILCCDNRAVAMNWKWDGAFYIFEGNDRPRNASEAATMLYLERKAPHPNDEFPNL